MLSEFAGIVDEIVRGAETLKMSLISAREELATIVHQRESSLTEAITSEVIGVEPQQPTQQPTVTTPTQTIIQQIIQPPHLEQSISEETTVSEPLQQVVEQLRELTQQVSREGEVLDLDQFAATNARAITAALQRTTITTQPQRAAEITRQATETRTREERRREIAPPASPLQRLLRMPRIRRRLRAWERAPSPVRQYLGERLRRYSEGGNIRQLLRELRLAPRRLAQPEVVQRAAQAGISAEQLSRGAAMLGTVGRVGGTVLGVASAAAGPLAIIAALVAIVTTIVTAFLRFNAALQRAVFGVEQFARSLSGVHGGMAAISFQEELRRWREQQQTAQATYSTTQLAYTMAAWYRSQSQELRALGQNLHNLGLVASTIAMSVAKIVTGFALIEKLAGPLNDMINGVLSFLKARGLVPEPPTEMPWLEWLESYRQFAGRVDMRKRPDEPFNRGPKEK